MRIIFVVLPNNVTLDEVRGAFPDLRLKGMVILIGISGVGDLNKMRGARDSEYILYAGAYGNDPALVEAFLTEAEANGIKEYAPSTCTLQCGDAQADRAFLASATITASKLEPVDRGKISDGYHTFNELYEHRHLLFINLMQMLAGYRHGKVWRSRLNSDGTEWPGWFVAGFQLHRGEVGTQVTYHLPLRLWDLLNRDDIRTLERGEWDGHTSADVVERLTKWAKGVL